MSENTRTVTLIRTDELRYTATNARGGALTVSSGDDADFSPVELLLAALAGCPAVDVDLVVSRRAEPTRFTVTATGEKTDDADGHHLTGLRVTFDLAFPDDAAGAAAEARVPQAIRASHDRLCTVARTIELPTPVIMDRGTAG